MTTATLERIVADIDSLALPDQLWLMERLAHRIRERTLPRSMISENDLVVMAADPAIQYELHLIATEFAATEADGLDE